MQLALGILLEHGGAARRPGLIEPFEQQPEMPGDLSEAALAALAARGRIALEAGPLGQDRAQEACPDDADRPLDAAHVTLDRLGILDRVDDGQLVGDGLIARASRVPAAGAEPGAARPLEHRLDDSAGLILREADPPVGEFLFEHVDAAVDLDAFLGAGLPWRLHDLLAELHLELARGEGAGARGRPAPPRHHHRACLAARSILRNGGDRHGVILIESARDARAIARDQLRRSSLWTMSSGAWSREREFGDTVDTMGGGFRFIACAARRKARRNGPAG